MPTFLPHDMEYDVPEEEVVTSIDTSSAILNDSRPIIKDTPNVSNERKRQRVESTILQTSVDISDLSRRLADHVPLDKNKFGILSVLADIDLQGAPPAVNHQTQINDDDQQPVTGNKWCPPIIVYNVNIKALVDTLKSTIPEFSFKVKNVNKSKSKLYFSDPKVHTSMMAILRTKNIHSYSFTPKELKQQSLILRGLATDTEVEAIKRELDTRVPDTVASVTKFKTPRSVKQNVDTGLFLVSLLPGKSLSNVSNIHGLQNQVISWEKPKRKDSNVQCHRCQRWGHISRNCNSAYNCVKCDQEHAPGECQRSREDSSDPYCSNCEKTGHPANWRGCPTYKKYLTVKKKKMTKVVEEKTIASENVNRAVNMTMRSPGKTYASFFQNVPSQQNSRQPKSSVIDDFLRLANYFLDPEELSLEQEINIFLNEYRNMSKPEAKAEFLRLLNKVRAQYGP